jgi:hypothetical protein
MNKRIESLLKKKERNDKLDRLLDLYGRLDSHIEAKPTILDRFKAAKKTPEGPSDQTLIYVRTDIPGRKIDITVPCNEVLYALRDYYERKIVELMETDNREVETVS